MMLCASGLQLSLNCWISLKLRGWRVLSVGNGTTWNCVPFSAFQSSMEGAHLEEWEDKERKWKRRRRRGSR